MKTHFLVRAKGHFAIRFTEIKSLCGIKTSDKNKHYFAEPDSIYDIQDVCRTCQMRACEDCNGSGFIGGHNAGIYCPCAYGEAKELKREGAL